MRRASVCPVLPIGAEVLPGKITLKGGRLRSSSWRRAYGASPGFDPRPAADRKIPTV